MDVGCLMRCLGQLRDSGKAGFDLLVGGPRVWKTTPAFSSRSFAKDPIQIEILGDDLVGALESAGRRVSGWNENVWHRWTDVCRNTFRWSKKHSALEGSTRKPIFYSWLLLGAPWLTLQRLSRCRCGGRQGTRRGKPSLDSTPS